MQIQKSDKVVIELHAKMNLKTPSEIGGYICASEAPYMKGVIHELIYVTVTIDDDLWIRRKATEPLFYFEDEHGNREKVELVDP